MTRTAHCSLKKGLEQKHNAKAFYNSFTVRAKKEISEHVPAAKPGLKMYPLQEMAALKGTQE